MPSFKLVQPLPSAARGWWMLFFFGADDYEAMRDALPGFGIVATADKMLTVTASDVRRARDLLGPAAKNLTPSAAGFSAGCQSVRSMLYQGIGLQHVAVFDGTHAEIPPRKEQIEIWQSRLNGPGRFIATCSSMGYTERIAPGKPGRATSTRHVLEAVVGAELVVGQPWTNDFAHVERFHSADTDGDAHMLQQNVIAPALLAGYFGVLPDLVPNVAPAPDPKKTIGARLLDWARGELEAGVREQPNGSNDGPRIRQYFTTPHFERDDAKTGRRQAIKVSGLAWCAAAACCGIFEVLVDGEACPIVAYRVSGIELQQDAMRVGAWARGDAEIGQPGDLAIFERGKAGGWERHVAIVESDDGETLVTIGGNEDNAWKRTTHTDRPIGFVRVDRTAASA